MQLGQLKLNAGTCLRVYEKVLTLSLATAASWQRTASSKLTDSESPAKAMILWRFLFRKSNASNLHATKPACTGNRGHPAYRPWNDCAGIKELQGVKPASDNMHWCVCRS